MKHLKNIFLISVILTFLPVSMDAQFYITGDDPGKAKWKAIDTDNFSIIYPEGTCLRMQDSRKS